jgi:hypothetical protein
MKPDIPSSSILATNISHCLPWLFSSYSDSPEIHNPNETRFIKITGPLANSISSWWIPSEKHIHSYNSSESLIRQKTLVTIFTVNQLLTCSPSPLCNVICWNNESGVYKSMAIFPSLIYIVYNIYENKVNFNVLVFG